MADRRTVGSWLEGPASLNRDPDDYPGRRLGLPESGTGAVARFGRRLLALCVDWALAVVTARLLFGTDEWAPLGVFALEQALLVGLFGGGVGHRVTGLKVVRLDGSPVGVVRGAARAVLLALAVPALIWDRDQRGLHDRFLDTVLLRV